MTLEDYAAIARVVWPDTPEAYILNKAALVRDVEQGEPCHALTCMSRAEREHIERLLKEQKEAVA